jgi:hypothetical protein
MRTGTQSAAASAFLSIGGLILIFFILLPAEGVLRKWLFNNVEAILGFIRDPILLSIYGLYFSRARRLPSWFRLYTALGGALFLFALAHALINGVPPVVTLLGLRAYILYVPLAFIMAECWREADVRRFLIICLWLAIPVALLVFIQFSSPVAHWINKGTSDDIEGRFTVAFGIVRPYGPFTFAQAQNTFAAMMMAVWLIAWEKRKVWNLPFPLLCVGGFAILSMGALSGGRTFFGGAILIGLASVLAGLTSRNARQGATRLARVVLATLAFVTVFVIVFPRSFEAMSSRQAAAVASEGSTLERAFRSFTDIIEPLQTAPFFGRGLGAGSNAALRLSGEDSFIYGETEWGRIIHEGGPLVGVLVILARIGFTLWLGWYCVAVNRRTGDGTPLILFGFCGYLTLIAQTTGQNQLLSFCWFSVGLTLCLCRLAEMRTPPRQSRTQFRKGQRP